VFLTQRSRVLRMVVRQTAIACQAGLPGRGALICPYDACGMFTRHLVPYSVTPIFSDYLRKQYQSYGICYGVATTENLSCIPS